MKHIEVSTPGANNLVDIKGEDLKIIDGKSKLIVNDGDETIAVFSSFYYWVKVGKDTVDDNEEYEPDKGAQRRIIEKEGPEKYKSDDEAQISLE